MKPKNTHATSSGFEVPAVRTSGLAKHFRLHWKLKSLQALSGLDLEVARGEVFGLLGPNGSGKSTTLKLLLGLLRPSAGRAEIFGQPAGSLEARRRCGFLPENPYFPNFLSGREVLRYYGRLVDLRGKALEMRIDALLEQVELSGSAAARPLKTYSKGMLQRIGLAQALLNDPDLLLLDEPTAGVDPAGSRQIRDLILNLKQRGKTVIFSSHLLEQVQEVSDRVLILHRGEKLREGKLDDLLSVEDELEIRVKGLGKESKAKLKRWLVEQGGRGVAIGHPKMRLEDWFIRAIGEEDSK